MTAAAVAKNEVNGRCISGRGEANHGQDELGGVGSWRGEEGSVINISNMYLLDAI